MNTTESGTLRAIVGAGGVLMIVALFLPWEDVGGVSRSGWEFWTVEDLLLVVVGIFAIGTALTGGGFGLFRPDMSLAGATDLLSVLSTLLLAWLVFFDFPAGADREIGAFLGLLAAATIAGGAGDWRVLRGGPVFPRTDGG
jgi:hypothetical protein